MWGSIALGLIALAMLAIAPLAQAAPGGGLRQFGSTKGCITDEAATPSGCEDVRGMQGINGDMVISPNGRQLYVPAETKQAIVVFNRDTATGALTQKSGANGCITSSPSVAAADNCATAASGQLTGVKGLAISPDGKDLYSVNNQGRLLSFDLDDEGNLTYRNESNFCGCDLRAVAVSPDGFSIYAGGPGTAAPGFSTNYDGIVGIYNRDQTNGAIGAFRGFFTGSTYGTVVPAMSAVASLQVTPDNKQLIVTNGENLSCCDWTVLAFDRTTSGGSQGLLTAPNSASRCVSGTSVGNCQTRAGQSYPQGTAITDGGRTIQVASYETVSTITRDPDSGNISPNASGNCFSYSASISGCNQATPQFNDFGNMRGIAVTPDGADLYVASQASNGGLWGFSRGGDGSLSQKPRPFGCSTISGSPGCSTLRGGVPTRTMVAAPGSRNVYAGGGNRLFSFVLDRAPVCNTIGTGTPHNTAVAVTLDCADPDGDDVSYEIVSNPVRGNVGAVQGNSVTYGPLVGSSGQDSFGYRAVAAGVPSDPVTVSVDVAGPPPPPPPPPVVIPKPTRILGITMPFAFSKSTKTYTVFTLLQVKGIPSGSTLKVSCKAPKRKKCPAKSFTKRNAKGTVSLKKWLKKRLAAGTKVTATITKPGRIGAVKIMTVKKRARPSFADRCLNPGAKKPTRC
jgi:sugar lactone lactonase YvrE